MFEFNDTDLIFETSWSSLSAQSRFDVELKSSWSDKEQYELFRYKYQVERFVRMPGKFGFLAVLNTNRGTKRRVPIQFHSVMEPFNDEDFNFTKVDSREFLFGLRYNKNSATDTDRVASDQSYDVLAINASPLGDFHSLILPKMSSKLPQSINEHSLRLALQIILLSASPAIRIGFNSLCAFASVNHLHLHLYYLPHKMYLESCDLEHLSGPCYKIKEYPANGFVFILRCDDKLSSFVEKVFVLIYHLQNYNIPHNIYITRGIDHKISNIADDKRNCIRIYVWARNPSGYKEMDKFTPAICELFGHLVIKDQAEFDSFTEENISKILKDVTQSTFTSILNNIKTLYLNL
ncbi:GDP-D-glucose phosphorylase 1 isoform X2 [Adelges cooleyi]|uniref:GDP-D-glucose phosphorylase 1 isoform X2 n=1 Tax=Adelges cooleyi TaxID=133065 RepID=UPI00217FCC4C|nr:GDP-D-glucose phosphorylase 1 isoform X2 [Adelges cooleyi]